MARSESKSWEIILNDGGLRSLVASAMSSESPWQAFLYVHDGRPNNRIRYEFFARQTERYGAAKQIELTMPHLLATSFQPSTDPTIENRPREPLHDMQLLAAAAAKALDFGAERLIWPVQAGDDFDSMSAVTEITLMVQQIIQFRPGQSLQIDTPLLDLTDMQLIEVGQQLGVPWDIARSCQTAAVDPCGRCNGCLWRARAFALAGIGDPLVNKSAREKE